MRVNLIWSIRFTDDVTMLLVVDNGFLLPIVPTPAKPQLEDSGSFGIPHDLYASSSSLMLSAEGGGLYSGSRVFFFFFFCLCLRVCHTNTEIPIQKRTYCICSVRVFWQSRTEGCLKNFFSSSTQWCHARYRPCLVTSALLYVMLRDWGFFCF